MPENIPQRPSIESLPELAKFIDFAERTITPKNWDSFWNCEQSFMELVQSGFITRLVAFELERMAEDSSYLPIAVMESEMPIYNSRVFRLILRFISANTEPPPRLYSVTEHSMTGVIGDSTLEAEVFEQPNPFPNDILDRQKRLLCKGRQVFDRNRLLQSKAGYGVVRLLPMPHDVCLLQFFAPTLLSLRWSYDDKSLLPVGAIAASAVSSRLQFAAKALMHFKDASSVLPLTKLTRHPDHFVRWQAITALTEVQFESGVAALNEALQDQHPHIRNAAKTSLDQLNAITE